MRAIISVFDKTGVVDFARGLEGLGFELFSTGGTEALLRESGVAVRGIQELTGFPEMLGGRVKTLHPAVHGGILALRDDPGHLEELARQGLKPVDVVVANLPYLPESERRPEYDAEPDEAIYAPGDGLGPLRTLVALCADGKLAMPGWVLVQYQRDVLEADCQHLPELREELDHRAPVA